MLGLIVLASVPAGLAGYFLNDIAEHSLRSPLVISIMLVVVGVIMLISEKVFKHRKVEETGLKDAIIIGIAQALAIIPGLSFWHNDFSRAFQGV